MRWSMVRLIWMRELRDQLRDRRTVLMIVGLPLVLYPLLGFVVLQFAIGFVQRPALIGIVRAHPGEDDFPACFPERHSADYPSLLRHGKIHPAVWSELDASVKQAIDSERIQFVFFDTNDLSPLEDRRIDVLLAAPKDFFEMLEKAESTDQARPPKIRIEGRLGDDYSKQSLQRIGPLFEAWKNQLLLARVQRRDLPKDFLLPFGVDDATGLAASVGGKESFFDLMVRLFPFMLVMWSLAGALYPAVDLCAGEKERGTMETLLITPAGREEIVYGKFLTIWVFSFTTAMLNLVSMGITTGQFAARLPEGAIPVLGLAWCIVLSLPLSALFSAVCLAIGAYARSSKEGQYYLLPLFLLTMPLSFLTLAPGVELNPLYSMIPVTGVSLLMQKMMTPSGLEQLPWLYFAGVLAPIGLYSWLALRWAIEQFKREDVLFREAERMEWGLWFRRLFAEKEALPTAAQAFFAATLLLVFRWFSIGWGSVDDWGVATAITSLAFVAFPVMAQALMLNTMPRQALYLRLPYLRDARLAGLLAIAMLPLLLGLSREAFSWFPDWLQDRHPLTQMLAGYFREGSAERFPLWPTLLTLAFIPSVAEEIAFRGLILTGLQRWFRPRNAVFLSAFLFALFSLNVFLFIPAFILGTVLGLLTLRSRSILPAILLHFSYNALLLLGIHLQEPLDQVFQEHRLWLYPLLGMMGLAGALILLWGLYRKPYDALERRKRGPG